MIKHVTVDFNYKVATLSMLRHRKQSDLEIKTISTYLIQDTKGRIMQSKSSLTGVFCPVEFDRLLSYLVSSAAAI